MARPTHSKLHALAVPLPFQGHINPLLDLSKKLVRAGFMVTFANTHINHERITASHTDAMTTSEDKGGGDLKFMSLGEDLLIERDSPLETLIEVFKPAMRGAVERLLVQLNKKEPPVSLLVFDFKLLCGLDVAIAAGIPSLSLWTQNAASFVCNLLVSRGFQPPTDDATLFTCAKSVPPLKRKEITGIFIEALPPPFPVDECGWSPFRRVAEPTWIVMNTFEDLELETLDIIEETLGFRPLTLGPLVTAPSFNISKGVRLKSFQSHLEWLQGHPKDSVLYIAFGTVVDFSEMQLEELVCGLETSKQPFLWVFRTDFCAQSEKYTLESLSNTLGNQGLLVAWAPQRDVLSHPSVGGFLTHCGWNSIIEGITIGVPMLAWPISFDQFLNKRCVVEQWGVGLGFDDDGTNGLIMRMEVEDKIKTLMNGRRGKEIREKAKSLSDLARRAYYTEGGSSCMQFNHLKEQICSSQ